MPNDHSQLFFFSDPEPNIPEGALTRAYLGKEPPDNLSRLWEAGAGVWLFLKIKKADLDIDAFLPQLLRLLAQPTYLNTRLLWLDRPGEPSAAWRPVGLAVDGSGREQRLSRTAFIDLRNYSLALTRHALIRLEETTGSLIIESPGQAQGFAWYTGHGENRLTGVGSRITLPLRGAQAGCFQFDLQVKKEGDSHTGFGYPDLTRLDAGLRLFMPDPAFPETGTQRYLTSHRYPWLQENCRQEEAWLYYPDFLSFQFRIDPLHPLAAQRSHLALQTPEAPWQETGIPSAYRTNLGYTVHLLPQGSESRLVFAERPYRTDPGEEDAPLYLTPSGEYALRVPRYHSDGALDLDYEDNLVCGLSGVEYIKLPRSTGNLLHFQAGAPAYAAGFIPAFALLQDLPALIQRFGTAPLTKPDAPDVLEQDSTIEDDLGISQTERMQLLTILEQDYFPPDFQFDDTARAAFRALSTLKDMTDWLRKALSSATLTSNAGTEALLSYPSTSWVYVRQAGSVPSVYFAQPDRAVLHQAGEGGPDFLDYLEVPAVELPAQPVAGAVAFPMLPYGNVDGKRLSDMKDLETYLLSNLRRRLIQQIAFPGGEPAAPAAANGQENKLGVTPQGLLATFSADLRDWQSLLLARCRWKGSDADVLLSHIREGSPLKTVLQSNQLFLVATQPESFERYFNKNNQLVIQDWVFELGPQFWPVRETIFIAKFHQKPLLDLAADVRSWSQPAAFNDNPAAVSERLVALLKEAVQTGQSADLKQRRKYEALARAATTAGWTGIIALNVHVPPGNLPDELAGLAAGIDPDKFYARYVGIETTPVLAGNGQLVARPSSLFGLIDYRNEESPPPHSSGYNFQVRLLSVVFENSLVKDFAAEIIVTLDRLFDENTALRNSPDGRNILTLKGTAENHDGKTTYSFSFSGDSHFRLPDSAVLHEAQLLKAQFITDPKTGPEISARFFFWGRLNFKRLEAADVLSFGQEEPVEEPNEKYLSFANLQLALRFSLPLIEENADTGAVTDHRTFTFNPQALSFDLKRSRVREQSLYAKFPLTLRNLQYSGAETPRDIDELGFMPVRTPIGGAKPEGLWYALIYDLQLGSLGALAGKADLVVSLMVAWSPGTDSSGAFVGLKLPGSSGGKKELTIQGVLKIAFKSIQLIVDQPSPERTGYLLKLKNIAFKFFVLSFPPGAQTEIIIFGDPDAMAGATAEDRERTVGWYAAYAKR